MQLQQRYPTTIDIVQIIPAQPGWELHFKSGGFEEIEDVVCFALHRNNEICAMWCDKKGFLRYPSDRKDFLRCFFRDPQG